jgi:hypothetical protein
VHHQNDIQGDSGGKVNIYGGYNIGNCDKRSPYEHVSNSEWLLTARPVGIYEYNDIVSGNKEKLHTVNLIVTLI